MKRCKKVVFEAQDGITFEVSDGANGELIIRATLKTDEENISDEVKSDDVKCDEVKCDEIKNDKANICYENYTNPPIPEGYKYVCGEWNNGFVIEKCSDRSQFVWVPVGSLDSNGTLDGVSFTEKFGRRNYQNDRFSEEGFHETLVDELALQVESVKKYGGFYISRYNISKNNRTGEPQSIKGTMPWVNISFDDAKKVSSRMEDNETIKSHLVFGAEYDSVLEWFIKSSRTYSEIAENSTEWGNFRNRKKSPIKVLETGKCEEWCTNNIYDFAGNVEEWTQELYGSLDYRIYRVLRGGDFDCDGYDIPVAYRSCANAYDVCRCFGFRIALYIK